MYKVFFIFNIYQSTKVLYNNSISSWTDLINFTLCWICIPIIILLCQSYQNHIKTVLKAFCLNSEYLNITLAIPSFTQQEGVWKSYRIFNSQISFFFNVNTTSKMWFLLAYCKCSHLNKYFYIIHNSTGCPNKIMT